MTVRENHPDTKRLERSCKSALRAPSRGVVQDVRTYQVEAASLQVTTGGMADEDRQHRLPIMLFSREWREGLHAVSERRGSRVLRLGSLEHAKGGDGLRLCGDGDLWSAKEEVRDIWNVGTIQRMRSRCSRSFGNGTDRRGSVLI